LNLERLPNLCHWHESVKQFDILRSEAKEENKEGRIIQGLEKALRTESGCKGF
jgi:hypothetical protein